MRIDRIDQEIKLKLSVNLIKTARSLLICGYKLTITSRITLEERLLIVWFPFFFFCLIKI